MADLFSDGFESGDLSAWDSSTTDGGNLSAEMAAALHGVYGLNCLKNDANQIFVTDDTPNAETRYRFRIYFDPNSITTDDWDEFSIVRCTDEGVTTIFYLSIVYLAAEGGFTTRVNYETDTGDGNSTRFPLVDGVNMIEIDWKASSAPGANDGEIKIYTGEDVTLKETVSNLDTDTFSIGEIDIGIFPWNVNNGTIYLDDFASNNDGSEIGPYTEEGNTGGFFIFLSEAYKESKKYFKNKGLYLPKEPKILIPQGI